MMYHRILIGLCVAALIIIGQTTEPMLIGFLGAPWGKFASFVLCIALGAAIGVTLRSMRPKL